MRSTDVLPAPCGPAGRRVWPEATAKLRLRKMRRPPLSHPRSCTSTRETTAMDFSWKDVFSTRTYACRDEPALIRARKPARDTYEKTTALGKCRVAGSRGFLARTGSVH